MANPNQEARSSQGKYVRTIEAAERDAEAADMYANRYTYQQIADALGFASKSGAFNAVHRAINSVTAKAGRRAADRREADAQCREQELELLWEAAMEVLESHHVIVSNGRVVELDGQPLTDHGPALQAVAELRRINESRRKLHGTDAPSRVSVEAETLGREIGHLLDAAFTQDAPDDDES